MKCRAYDTFFGNFTNETKLKIIYTLREKPLSVREIGKRIGEEQSKVSHNLSKLSKCNILAMRREGKQRIYSLNKKTVLPILKLVEKHVQAYCLGRCGK